MNPLVQLKSFGQSVWCDNVERRMIRERAFEKMIKEDGVSGVTSNPTIFEKAIAKSTDYDEELIHLGEQGMDIEDICWHLIIKDIRDVADIFLPVYQSTGGTDGFVSIEVSPFLAKDTQATIKQAKELWSKVERPNIMIKIPATREGLPAIKETIAAGINVNVTLIFSVERYREVVDAYISGLEKLHESGKTPDVSSVASFFISRVDTQADKRISELMKTADDAKKLELKGLLGKTAVSNSKYAYQEFERLFGEGRFLKLKEKGAKIQRPLWASTSTKNPEYSDVLYVEELIGPYTVNTLPPATVDCFRDHGKVKNTITENLDDVHATLNTLKANGIDLDDITFKLEEEGVKAFSDSFKKLLGSIRDKSAKIGVKTK